MLRGGLTVRVRASTLSSTIFSSFSFNLSITVYGLPFLADYGKYVAALSFIYFLNTNQCTVIYKRL